MENISLQDLERDLAGLLERVEAGERLVVCRGGRPVAAGSFVVPADFDAPLPDDLIRDFEGR